MKIKKFLLPIWYNRGLFPLGNKYFRVFVLNGLKPKYSHGIWWKKNPYWVLLIRVLWILKPCELFCLKPSIVWKICKKKTTHKFLGWPGECYHRFMYIALSTDNSLLTLKLPFKVILSICEVVVWCMEWEWCTFKRLMKIDPNPPILYHGFKNLLDMKLMLSAIIGYRSVIAKVQRG